MRSHAVRAALGALCAWGVVLLGACNGDDQERVGRGSLASEQVGDPGGGGGGGGGGSSPPPGVVASFQHNWVVLEVQKVAAADIRADVGSPPGGVVRDGVVDGFDVLAAECAVNVLLGGAPVFEKVVPCPVDYDSAAFAAVPSTSYTCAADTECAPSSGKCSASAICHCVPISSGVSWCEPTERTPGLPGCSGSSATAQYFSEGMVLCAGSVSWANRGTLCQSPRTPCTKAQWLARHGTKAPLFNAWTADNLLLTTSPTCYVSTTTGTSCPGGSAGVVVETLGDDALGSVATHWHCGDESAPSTNQFFGGCLTSAGTLCCE